MGQQMTNSTVTYWNALSPENQERWLPVQGLEGRVGELTLGINPITGEYTRLTRFFPNADTSSFGGKSHGYPEEVFIVILPRFHGHPVKRINFKPEVNQ